MKTNGLIAFVVLVGILMLSASVAVIVSTITKPKIIAQPTWMPKIGDVVVSRFHADGSSAPFTTTITNVMWVGSRSQTGMLVWGEGLPGIDSWWVMPGTGR